MASGIRRASLAAVIAIATVVLTPATASASGGGGCGREVSEGTGTVVKIRDYCFGPTILRVGTGEVVTFENLDPFEHSVLGANATWGDYAGFRRDKDVTYRFEEPGVYPYVCTYHVGMVGAIVVGSGAGGSIDTTTADGPVVRVEPGELRLQGASAPSWDNSIAWMVVWSVVVFAGVVAAVVLRHRRRRVRTPAGDAQP